ncbi:MAG: DinB family protein, partial [Pseudolabrys sp.]
MLSRYSMFAGYNAWCNERLYDATSRIDDADYRADRGVFFRSLHGTLNHLLVGDRIWMRRFTDQGEVPPGLGAILYDDFAQLRSARRTEDDRIR